MKYGISLKARDPDVSYRHDKVANISLSMNRRGSLKFVSTFGQFSVTNSDASVWTLASIYCKDKKE